MADHTVLFLTDRGERHQRQAIKSAPPGLDVIMKRRPPPSELMGVLPSIEFIVSERSEEVTAQMIAEAVELRLIYGSVRCWSGSIPKLRAKMAFTSCCNPSSAVFMWPNTSL